MRPDAAAKETAERENVDVRLYRVIYNAIEDVEAAMKGMLDPVFEEQVLGHAEVRQTFKVPESVQLLVLMCWMVFSSATVRQELSVTESSYLKENLLL